MNLDGLMLTKNKFTKMVESTVKKKTISYLDAIIDICSEHNIEIDDIKKFISPAIKSKLEAEAIKLNLMVEKNNSLELE